MAITINHRSLLALAQFIAVSKVNREEDAETDGNDLWDSFSLSGSDFYEVEAKHYLEIELKLNFITVKVDKTLNV